MTARGVMGRGERMLAYVELWFLALTAIGTLSLAIASTFLGVREILLRAEKRRDAAQISAVLLWPILRKYLAAITTLQDMDYLDEDRAFPPDTKKAVRAIGYLNTIYDQALGLIRDLEPIERQRGFQLAQEVFCGA